MTPLPVQDALLLALVMGSMCVIVLGDLSAYLRRRRGVSPTLGGCGHSPDLRKPASTGKSVLRPALSLRAPLIADLLVVDDSAVARAKLRKLFLGSGYSLQVASDGVEALTLLRKGRYSLMITDLEMPNMGGVELIHECRRQPHTAGMPIIAVSAHENLRATFNECRDICGVHRKPWVDDILLSHVATLVGRRNPAIAFGSQCVPGAA